jgi:pilus assembly protein Flp/PilA
MSRSIAAAGRFLAGEDGASMVEYGLMVALIATFCVAVITLVGSNIQTKFDSVSDAVSIDSVSTNAGN